MGYFSELDAEGAYRTCGEADEDRRCYPAEYRLATTQRATTPDVDKRYTFNGDDFDIFVSIDGDSPQYIGSAATRTQAEKRASDYVIDYFEYTHTPETVARLVMEGV